MQLHFFGHLPEEYLAEATIRALEFFPFHWNLDIYFLSSPRYSRQLLRTLPKNCINHFKTLLHVGKTSFSFLHHRRAVIIISLPKTRAFLLNNQQALMGLLLHELTHVSHMKQGLYQRLQKTYDKIASEYFKHIKNLRLAGAVPVVAQIGDAALLFMKDLYANSSLLHSNYGRYLLNYYLQEFKFRKTCPQPVFYDKLKQAIRRNVTVLADVFLFELALLSVILPFQKYYHQKSRLLINYITHCYQLNIQELSRKCADLVDFYLKSYRQPSAAFEEKYLRLLFKKVYGLLA